MASHAGANKGEYLKTMQTYLNLALKAQAQCRCTIEALNEIKNPKSVTITNQANIADQQIVNNGNMNTDTRAEKKAKGSNELLEEIEHERLDTGKKGAAIKADKGVDDRGSSQQGQRLKKANKEALRTPLNMALDQRNRLNTRSR